MTGSKATSMTPAEVSAARVQGLSQTDTARIRTRAPYVWDGVSEEDRPLSAEELRTGVEAYRRQRGRPVGSDKESTTIRFDRDILAAFRAGGAGWQTRMNAALRDWLETHRPNSST